MRLHIFSIVLDALPFLPMQFANYNRLPSTVDWHWSICEGAAMNVNCTKWCRQQRPRLSNDGTTEFLNELRHHPRITIHQRAKWMGKVDMVRTCLSDFRQPGIVLEADGDEIWLPHQLEMLIEVFKQWPGLGSAHFFCRYFVGPNIIITSEHSYGNRPTEWARCWRWTPELRVMSHEPPIMSGVSGECATRETTRKAGLVFDHFSYSLESQLRYKQEFYGYHDAVSHWRRLQANKMWPVKELRDFLPWVDAGVTADLLWR